MESMAADERAYFKYRCPLKSVARLGGSQKSMASSSVLGLGG